MSCYFLSQRSCTDSQLALFTLTSETSSTYPATNRVLQRIHSFGMVRLTQVLQYVGRNAKR